MAGRCLCLPLLVLLGACSLPPASPPADWPATRPASDCPDIAGLYADTPQHQFWPAGLPAPTDARLSTLFASIARSAAQPAVSLPERELQIAISQSAQQLKIEAVDGAQRYLLLQLEHSASPLLDINLAAHFSCQPGQVRLHAELEAIAGAAPGLAFAEASTHIALYRDSTAALLVRRSRVEHALVLLVPALRQRHGWQRFLPVP